ncbi:MAG: DUF2867 domain-containing protein [Rhodocyclales bacterium]|nr:DUF2867 domain-containing protein [Rhodocyclales bacterium]MBI5784071.1 DUF2867 domain-containing protein [Rhodocyclales bacterium]
MKSPAITSILAPPATRISGEIPGSDFHDCYAMPLAHGSRSALEIFLLTVARSPRWVESLMALRNRIVGLFGLKNLGHLGSLPPLKEASAYRIGDRVGIFTLLSATDDEVILGDSDKHLDVKVSLCKVMRDEREAVAVTTVVHIHNLLGHIYMLLVAPMHRIIAPAVMARGAEACHHG